MCHVIMSLWSCCMNSPSFQPRTGYEWESRYAGIYSSTANTRIALNSKLATIQFKSGTISLFLYDIHYSDNYQHTHVCMLIIIKCFHRITCPSLSNNGGSHLVSRKRSIDWPRYLRNFTCENANYVMIHW